MVYVLLRVHVVLQVNFNLVVHLLADVLAADTGYSSKSVLVTNVRFCEDPQ